MGPSPRSLPRPTATAPRGSAPGGKGFVARAGSEEREQLGRFLLALAWEVWLFIGGFVRVSSPPFSHLHNENSTGQMLGMEAEIAARSGPARQRS